MCRAGSRTVRWYHVCGRCNAKWFSSDVAMGCPRCGKPSHSIEKLAVPWLQTEVVKRASEQTGLEERS